MREEKKYLVEETAHHLSKSEYVYATDYSGMTVPEVADLRSKLAPLNAEFHVVKNSILKHSLKHEEMPELADKVYSGQTAIVIGGEAPSEVAKVVIEFHKKASKCDVKEGILGEKVMTREEVVALSKLPSLPEMRAQFLSLLSTPAQQMVRVVNAVPQSFVNVLQAKVREEG